MSSVTVCFISAQRPSFVLNASAGSAIRVGDVRSALHERTGVLAGDWRVVQDGRCLLDDLSVIESPTSASSTNLETNIPSQVSGDCVADELNDEDGRIGEQIDGTIVVFVLIRARVERLSCETPSFVVRVRGLASSPVVVGGHKRKSRNSSKQPASTSTSDVEQQPQQTAERTVKVSVTDSVRALKRRIARLSCCPFPADEQEIIFQGRKLDTSCFLGDQLLINNPIVRVVHRPNESKRFPLTLKLGSSLVFRVPITRKDTVSVLRRRLHRGYTFPSNLSYALVTQQGIPMRSQRTIGHYALTGSSVIRIMFPPASKLRMRRNKSCGTGRTNQLNNNINNLNSATASGVIDSSSSASCPSTSTASSSSSNRVDVHISRTTLGVTSATVSDANTSMMDDSNAERAVVARILAKAAAKQRQQRHKHQKDHMFSGGVLPTGHSHPLGIRAASTSTAQSTLVVGEKRNALATSNASSKRIKVIDASNADVDIASSSSGNMTQGRPKRRCIDRTAAVVIGTGVQTHVEPVVVDLLSDGDTESVTLASQVSFTSGGEDAESSAGSELTVDSNSSTDLNRSIGGRRRSQRCGAAECRKKLPLGMAHPCRCGMLCCSMHMLDHQCSFDYKKAHEKIVSSELAMELSAKHRAVPKI